MVHLDGHRKAFHFFINGQLVKTQPVKGLIGERMSFQDYLKHMLKQAQSEERLRQQQRR